MINLVFIPRQPFKQHRDPSPRPVPQSKAMFGTKTSSSAHSFSRLLRFGDKLIFVDLGPTGVESAALISAEILSLLSV